MEPVALLPSTIMREPTLRNLVSLTLYAGNTDNPTEIMREMQPHLPMLEFLELWEIQGDVVPPAVFDITTLRRLRLMEANNGREMVPDAIGKLTRLTNLDIKMTGFSTNTTHTVSPAIGTLSGLRSLLLSSNDLDIFPREVLYLTGLTRLTLRLISMHLSAELDIRILRNLRVLCLEGTPTDIPSVISNEEDFPQLEDLAFGEHGLDNFNPLSLALFRPQLRLLSMQEVCGPFPVGFAQRARNLTELSIEGGYVGVSLVS